MSGRISISWNNGIAWAIFSEAFSSLNTLIAVDLNPNAKHDIKLKREYCILSSKVKIENVQGRIYFCCGNVYLNGSIVQHGH